MLPQSEMVMIYKMRLINDDDDDDVTKGNLQDIIKTDKAKGTRK